MATSHPLFDSDELSDYLRQTVTPGQGAVAERVVWGWTKRTLKLEERPEQLDEELWPTMIQLGAIAWANPDLLESYQLGTERSVYSRENRDRLLRELKDLVAGGDGAGGSAEPTGSFPAPLPYPDPAERW